MNPLPEKIFSDSVHTRTDFNVPFTLHMNYQPVDRKPSPKNKTTVSTVNKILYLDTPAAGWTPTVYSLCRIAAFEAGTLLTVSTCSGILIKHLLF
jgi:hypothetical protein